MLLPLLRDFWQSCLSFIAAITEVGCLIAAIVDVKQHRSLAVYATVSNPSDLWGDFAATAGAPSILGHGRFLLALTTGW